MRFIDALNTTLKEEFRRNPDTFIWGQDVAYKEKGGIFNVTKGLQQEFVYCIIFNCFDIFRWIQRLGFYTRLGCHTTKSWFFDIFVPLD